MIFSARSIYFFTINIICNTTVTFSKDTERLLIPFEIRSFLIKHFHKSSYLNKSNSKSKSFPQGQKEGGTERERFN
jgi:hypothetical protein